jgi:endogenous inhibitor of DNA gyrase (YacG/DUF329 family)
LEANDNEAPKRHRCPICRRPAASRHRPFCSASCADVDLARWLSGAYVISTEEEPEAEDEAPPARNSDG